MKIIIAFLAIFAFSCAGTKTHNEESIDDGSEYVFKVIQNLKPTISYVKTSDLPASNQFKEQDNEFPVPGSIMWWNDYMGIYDPINKVLLCSKGQIPLDSAIQLRGKPRYFLYK